MEDSMEERWVYELDDGAPVNVALAGGQGGGQAGPSGHPSDEQPSRRPFGDISSNFTEFYADALAAAQELKSPDRMRSQQRPVGSRFSPNRCAPGSAAKRLWANELPPLPRPGGTNTQRVAAALGARPTTQDGSSSADGSPTRHGGHRSTQAGNGGIPPLPSLGPAHSQALGLGQPWSLAPPALAVSRSNSLSSNDLQGAGPSRTMPLRTTATDGVGGMLGDRAASVSGDCGGCGNGIGACPFPLPMDLDVAGSLSAAAGGGIPEVLFAGGSASGRAMPGGHDEKLQQQQQLQPEPEELEVDENAASVRAAAGADGLSFASGGSGSEAELVPPSPFPHLENQACPKRW